MSTTSRDDDPSAEIADLHKLETIMQHGLDTFIAARNALSAIREAWHSGTTPEPSARDMEVHIIVANSARQANPKLAPGLDMRSTAAPAGELQATMRRLMSQATGAVGDVTHLLETRGDALDEQARAQLRDDALLLDEELETLKVLLLAPEDWDAEYQGLLAGEIPPFEPELDDEDAEG